MTNTRTETGDPVRTQLLALGGLAFVLSAWATVYFCRSMAGGMEMPGGWTMSMMWMPMPGQTWLQAAAMFLLMWLAMMVAMMLPSAFPMWLKFREPLPGHAQGRGIAPVVVLAAAYHFVWLLVGAVVFVLGIGGAWAAMRSEGLSRIVPLLSGATLVASGVMQFTAWKRANLRRCRNPLGCAAVRNGDVLGEGWRCGLQQGVSCLHCCAAPMLALLALGTMNLVVMTLVAVVIGVEKLVATPELWVRFFGVAGVTMGLAVIVRALPGL